MAAWSELPDANQGDSLAYTEAWENRDRSGECPACGCLLGAGSFCTCSPHDRMMATPSPDDDDVEYADEDEAGQLGLGVPGEQRAIPTLARAVDGCYCPGDCNCRQPHRFNFCGCKAHQ